jgi:hypothetical protein
MVQTAQMKLVGPNTIDPGVGPADFSELGPAHYSQAVTVIDHEVGFEMVKSKMHLKDGLEIDPDDKNDQLEQRLVPVDKQTAPDATKSSVDMCSALGKLSKCFIAGYISKIRSSHWYRRLSYYNFDIRHVFSVGGMYCSFDDIIYFNPGFLCDCDTSTADMILDETEIGNFVFHALVSPLKGTVLLKDNVEVGRLHFKHSILTICRAVPSCSSS